MNNTITISKPTILKESEKAINIQFHAYDFRSGATRPWTAWVPKSVVKFVDGGMVLPMWKAGEIVESAKAYMSISPASPVSTFFQLA
jgi:hypothetical protein